MTIFGSRGQILKLANNTASFLVKIFRKFVEEYELCDSLVTDGGRQLTSSEFCDFLRKWGVKPHQTSGYTHHSNLRAETGVQSVKKIVSENTDNLGNLQVDMYELTILQYRNTPCQFSGQSPAQILYNSKLQTKRFDASSRMDNDR